MHLLTTVAKRFKRVDDAVALIGKVLMLGENGLRRQDAPLLVPDAADRVEFREGISMRNEGTWEGPAD